MDLGSGINGQMALKAHSRPKLDFYSWNSIIFWSEHIIVYQDLHAYVKLYSRYNIGKYMFILNKLDAIDINYCITTVLFIFYKQIGVQPLFRYYNKC